MQRGLRMNLRSGTVPLRIAGHRGSGCTDSLFARANGNHLTRPPENTLASFMQALRPPLSADWIETDVIRTADDHLVLCHSTDYTLHVEPAGMPPWAHTIDELTLAEALTLPIGADGTARLLTLPALLNQLQHTSPGDGLVLNLELKDVQGTARPRREPSLAALVHRDIVATSLPLERIRFSSFSLHLLTQLAEIEPLAQCAMLFDLPLPTGTSTKRLFTNSEETYRTFTEENIAAVLHALPNLHALHPEISTLTGDTVKLAAQHGLEIGTWTWQEKSPTADAGAAATITKALALCLQHAVPLTLITDHILDVRHYTANCAYT